MKKIHDACCRSFNGEGIADTCSQWVDFDTEQELYIFLIEDVDPPYDNHFNSIGVDGIYTVRNHK